MRIQDKERFLYYIALLYSVCVYGTMAVMSIGAGLTMAAWLAFRWGHYREDWRSMRAMPVFWPTVFLGVACLWSLVWAKFSGVTFMGAKPTITWDDTRKVWHLAFPFVLFAVFASLKATHIRKVVKTWFWFGVASAVLGIVQYYVPIYDPMMLPHTRYEGYSPGTGFLSIFQGAWHATGFAGFHLSYAAIIAFPAAFGLALMAVLYRREGVSRRTWIMGGTTLLFFIANLCTYSKIAWMAMPLAVVLIAAIGFKGKARYFVIGAVLVFAVFFSSSSEFRARMGANTRTIEERKEVWNVNIMMIKQYPFFGVGWHRNSELSHAYYTSISRLGFESHAHNNVLDQWATTGLFGVIGFFWLNIVLVMLSFRIYNNTHDLLWRSLGLGLVGGWFCLQLNGLTQTNWWDAKVMHQIGWVTAITMEGYRRNRVERSQN